MRVIRVVKQHREQADATLSQRLIVRRNNDNFTFSGNRMALISPHSFFLFFFSYLQIIAMQLRNNIAKMGSIRRNQFMLGRLCKTLKNMYEYGN